MHQVVQYKVHPTPHHERLEASWWERRGLTPAIQEETPLPQHRFTRATGRWGLLVVALTLGALLLVFAAVGVKQTHEMADLMALGQIEALLTDLRKEIGGGRQGPPQAHEMASFYEKQSREGLRYLAMYSPDGTLEMKVGDSIEPGFTPARPIETVLLERIGPRVRTVRSALAQPPGMPRPRIGRQGGPPPRHGKRPPREARAIDSDRLSDSLPYFVLEIEPLVALKAQRRTLTLFGVGAAVALGLLLSAVFLWRQSIQAEALEATLEAQRRLAALGEMSAVLAHEIKNPLASLKGQAQLLEERLDADARSQKKAAKVVKQVMRLEALILQLLDFVRSGKVDLKPVDISKLAQEAADEVASPRIQLIPPEAPITTALDQDRMHQVLTNLMRNALQASPDGGAVEVCISSTKNEVHIEVLDRGEGLPPGEEASIFEPFRTHKAKGVGLGLAVARRIVELHAGSISAKNRKGGGAAFHIILPLR